MPIWRQGLKNPLGFGVTSGMMTFHPGKDFDGSMPPGKLGYLLTGFVLSHLACLSVTLKGLYVGVFGHPTKNPTWAADFRSGVERRSFPGVIWDLTFTPAPADPVIVFYVLGEDSYQSPETENPLNPKDPAHGRAAYHEPLMGHQIYVSGYLGDRYMGSEILRGNADDLNGDEKHYFQNAYESPPDLVQICENIRGVASSRHLMTDGLRNALKVFQTTTGAMYYIKEKALPFSPPLQKIMHRRCNPQFNAALLDESQDYTLLFTIPAGMGDTVQYLAKITATPLTMIGHICQGGRAL